MSLWRPRNPPRRSINEPTAGSSGWSAPHIEQEYARRASGSIWPSDTEIDTARLVASAEMLTEQRENDARYPRSIVCKAKDVGTSMPCALR